MEAEIGSTMSSNRSERIKARRERIKKRSQSTNDSTNQKNKAEADSKRLGAGKQQISDSLTNLDNQKIRTIEELTSIRVEVDVIENARRIQEEEKRQERLRFLQVEAVNSGKSNAAVEMRWAELMEQNMPHELIMEMSVQKQSCDAIIAEKNSLIKTFQTELKNKDEEYVKALKRHEEDIELLLARMKGQYETMRSEYCSELDRIEDAFLQERQEVLLENKSELDGIFEKRRKMEMAYMEAKQEREEQYQRELDELRTADAEDYNKLKIKLETNIQTLEQQLEEMRATYQLNTEKLEYNYRVLTERDMENSATLAQQKRRLTRLKDSLSTLTNKYHVADQKYKQENMELTDEYRRITKQYKDLQSKFKHFEMADNKKYQQVWAMHEAEVKQKVAKLVKADRILTEQVLGFEWDGGGAATQMSVSASSATLAESLPSSKAESNEEDSAAPAVEISKAKVKCMLDMLTTEASFLVDPTLKESLAELKPEEAAKLQAESILKALGVETEEDLAALLGFFFHSIQDADEDDLLQFGDQDAIVNNLKIGSDDVVRVIKKFVEKKEMPTASKNFSSAAASPKTATLDKNPLRDAQTSQEEEFWVKLTTMVPERSAKVWTALEKATSEYYTIIQDRSTLLEDVHSLHAQNEQLKARLNKYLKSQVVQDLVIPPTQTIRVDNQ